MNLLEYVNILLRRGWILLLLALVAAGSAWWLGTRQTPVYRATQRVLMQPTRADFGLTEASKTLLGNHVAYLDSEFPRPRGDRQLAPRHDGAPAHQRGHHRRRSA